MEQSVSKIQDYLSDDQLVQTDSAFVGSFLWKAVDLVTFGVLEKPPKKKWHQNEHYNDTEPL